MNLLSFTFLAGIFLLLAVQNLPFFSKRAKSQNALLLVVGYLLYAGTDIRGFLLLLVSTIAYYFLGIAIQKRVGAGEIRKAYPLTFLGVAFGVGLLLYFKYLGFFIQSLATLAESLGWTFDTPTLHILLPLGLSFYTFRLISYVIEIYRARTEAERNFVDFALYISFFPCIVSGPIDRPNAFLSQIKSARLFRYADFLTGCRMILWGMFLKICIADTLAPTTDAVWQSLSDTNGAALLLSALTYPVQMYSDFCGYSLLAIGIGRLLGLRITPNFRTPFFARNVAEYWRRWHMSLTSWITDYVFMPLNILFRDYARLGTALAVIINLIVIGMWHGANWTYALFGLYHGLLFIPLIYGGQFGKTRKLKPGKWELPKAGDALRMLATYLLVTVAFILFRAPDVSSAMAYFTGFFSESLFTSPQLPSFRLLYVALIMLLFIADWVYRNDECVLCFHGKGLMKYRAARWMVYYALLFAIYANCENLHGDFIYSQF